MGLFGNKEPVQCDICGNNTGTKENKKHKAKDGVICNDCYAATGLLPGGGCFGIPIAVIKEQLESDDGVGIMDRALKYSREGIDQRAQQIETQRAERRASTDNEARCPKCGSSSISADKKGFGVGKAVIGAAVAGPLGMAAGNIGAKKVRVTCLKCGNQWMAGQG